MSEKKKIVKIYNDKIKKYINFSKAYFEKDNPHISVHLEPKIFFGCAKK